ncbi:hypothetical protein HT136_02145 [Novosphingobium profundi]|uniref:hypothetical protein n=1 Tax=Novosphingobium profundi TaxID=1774954 RepID=UPI001BD9AB98|nr:hypothetical protein [Novosphingobium profundi]MBT0667168.1 hypothetical protein [Novosphingobium profundi]
MRSDDPRVTAEARTICHWLSQRKVFSDIHYIHFARQVDYSQVDGARVVSAIFPIDRTDALAGWIEAETGLALDIPHDHARREPKAWSRTAQPAVRHLARTLLPRKVRNGLYPLWMKSPAFATASDRYGDIRFDASTEDFISEFYADDAALYDEACEALGKRPDAQPVRKRRDA